MKERPILFSGAMVRAVLAGTKTQTRRIVKPVRDAVWGCEMAPHELVGEVNAGEFRNCRYGEPGDRLWGRETHLIVGGPDAKNPRVVYRATNDGPDAWLSPVWRPSIHMPRWACRLVLPLTQIRGEKLSAISREDALAEGIVQLRDGGYGLPAGEHYHSSDPRESYWSLWEAINGPGSVMANPWVYVLGFPSQAAS